jgi:hypothetical protein
METYRIAKDVGLYYVTFTVVEWLPIFINESSCRLSPIALNTASKTSFWASTPMWLGRCIFMPFYLTLHGFKDYGK